MNKRQPERFTGKGPKGTHARYAKLSKAEWAEVFADLYCQMFGEDASTEDILADAERRAEILAGYRKAEQ